MNFNESMGIHRQGNDVQNKNNKKKFMILRVGEDHYGIFLHQVREVIATNQMTILPSMPDFFAGVINLRGKIIPTVYLNKSLRTHEDKPDKLVVRKPCIVITEFEGTFFGALVDDVSEVVTVNLDQVDNSMNQDIEYHDLFLGVIKIEKKKPIPILNLEKSLRIDELRKKQNFENIDQENK